MAEIQRPERVAIVNKIIIEISDRSRRFFHYKGNVAQLIDAGGKIYYHAEWSDRPLICLNTRKESRQADGWQHGMTLWMLCQEFLGFIEKGEPLEYSGLYTKHWGYEDSDMLAIQNKAKLLNYLK